MINATLSALDHRGARHIKVEIPNTEQARQLIRQVAGRKWSKTHGCWYVPYTTAAYRQLRKLFEVKTKEGLPVSKLTNHIPADSTGTTPVAVLRQGNGSDVVRVEREHDRRMKVFVPAARKDWIEKVKEIPGRAWNRQEKYWSVPLVQSAVDHLRRCFGELVRFGFEVPEELPAHYYPKKRKALAPSIDNPDSHGHQQRINKSFTKKSATEQNEPGYPSPAHGQMFSPPDSGLRPVYRKVKQQWGEQQVITGTKMIVEQWDQHWLCAYIPYDRKDWLADIKQIPGRLWKTVEKCWLLPFTLETLEWLEKFGGDCHWQFQSTSQGIPAKWIPPKRSGKAPKRPLNDIQRLAVTALEERLVLEFKSHRTIKTYRNILIALLHHYPKTRPSKISIEQLRQYIIYKRREKNIKASTLNQLINALNAFYGRVLNQSHKVQQLERPKRDRTMPNFASEEEIVKLLKGIENIKHKCMLMLIYSAGLRKGELLNLRVRDMNKSAQVIFVKGGKGRKDRYALYSPKVIKLVDEYQRMYKPKYWLFEGQKGGKYSETSLQSIFERAKANSGINPHLTIHGLRHSFATHLVYKNVPLHEVKKLLGHESIRTTEVYLHIAQRYKKEIQSPLEDLDI